MLEIKARLHFFILINGFFIDLANLVLVGMPNHNHVSDWSIENQEKRENNQKCCNDIDKSIA